MSGRSLRQALWLGSPVLAVLILLALDALCYQAALPLTIEIDHSSATLLVDGQRISLGHVAPLTGLQFAPEYATVHEYQLDGSDSTNNFSLDAHYLDGLSKTPYYRFQSWMRDLDGTSRWRDLQVWQTTSSTSTPGGAAWLQISWPTPGAIIKLPSAGALRISVQLQRPETPRTLNLLSSDGSKLQIWLDRNDRQIHVTRLLEGGVVQEPVATSFFPIQPLPFAAEVADTAIRALLWAELVLLVATGSGFLRGWLSALRRQQSAPQLDSHEVQTSPLARPTGWIRRTLVAGWLRLTTALHPFALLCLGLSLLYTIWIALVLYHAQPHIYDAASYFFAAKMYARGELSAPIPLTPDLFPGPFMVQFQGRWFSQYAPGTALTLAPGLLLGVPYLVEPVLGTCALIGIGLIAARLFDRRVATLAVILGTLSPFYSYLAASYLSHAIALFYLVWGFWALLAFAQSQGRSRWLLPLAAALLGMMLLTREQVTVLYLVLIVAIVLLVTRHELRANWRRWLVPSLVAYTVFLLFVALSLAFNNQLTGDPLTTPRQLFFAGDHWGFGNDVGFYGQHTLAAGLVNLDEQSTILAIDLFGWPFYLTLACLVLPFIAQRPSLKDWLLLFASLGVALAFVGYFYHGIYLGPRYFFETLPFLLMLAARGILALQKHEQTVRKLVEEWWRRRSATDLNSMGKVVERRAVPGWLTLVLFIGLLACNLLYYTPRQITRYTNYSGLPGNRQLDLQAIYHPTLQQAIVVSDDPQLYALVLFALNDPDLRGNVLYALANTEEQYAELRRAFPDRTLYRLQINPDNSVQYVRLDIHRPTKTSS